jgi:hypothetical protein
MAAAAGRDCPGFELYASTDYLPWIDQSFRYTSRSAPFAAVGDFNGDGLEDAALHGHTRAESLVLVVLSGPRGYRAEKRHVGEYEDPKAQQYGGGGEWQYGLSSYIQLARRGRLWSPSLGRALRLGNDSYLTVAFERGSSLYLYRRGHWRYYPVAD